MNQSLLSLKKFVKVGSCSAISLMLGCTSYAAPAKSSSQKVLATTQATNTANRYEEVKKKLAAFPSAAESDPAKLGIMQGTPPSDDKIISFVDLDAVQFPQMRYTFTNVREFLPTKNIASAKKDLHYFEQKLDTDNIDKLTFTPMYSRDVMTFKDSLPVNYTDSMLILHKGKIVYEKYFGVSNADTPHHLMSVTKTFAGTLGALLVKEGVIDENKQVQYYVPELKGSAWGDATVRQVLDMTVGLDFTEDYEDPQSDNSKYSISSMPFIPTKKGESVNHFYKYLQTVKKKGEHGQKFDYKTPNADVIAWVIARATGKDFNQVLSEKIWQPLGTQEAAYMLVDKAGTPFAGGGMSATSRDLARFGEMMRNNGYFNGKRILPASLVAEIKAGGDRHKFTYAGYDNLKGWSYKDMWWVSHNEDGAFTARGIHGQTIYVDPKAEMVLIRTASSPVPSNAVNDIFSLPAYQAVADYLKNKK